MTRDQMRVSIKMRPNGPPYILPCMDGDIIIYKDQEHAIMNMVSKCKTRGEAQNLLQSFSGGIDHHHLSTRVINIAKKKTSKNTKPMKRPITKPVVSNDQVKVVASNIETIE